MPGPIAACFRCAAAASPSSGAGAAGPSLATSVYETHLGLVALSWSRTSFGLSLRAVLRLSPPPNSAPGSSSSASGAGYLDDDADEEEEATLAFRARPWFLWRRRGSRRFRAGDRLVDLAWDLSRARFPGSGSPEPSSGFFVAVVVDGEMVLAAGDLPDAAYRRTRARRPPGSQRPVLLSRREHVSLRDAGAGRGRSHTTWVTVQGKEREISMDLVTRGRGRDKGAARGSELVDLGGADGVQVSWDLHNCPPTPPHPPTSRAPAVLVFHLRGPRRTICLQHGAPLPKPMPLEQQATAGSSEGQTQQARAASVLRPGGHLRTPPGPERSLVTL